MPKFILLVLHIHTHTLRLYSAHNLVADLDWLTGKEAEETDSLRDYLAQDSQRWVPLPVYKAALRQVSRQ